jgi:hypothetical protein
VISRLAFEGNEVRYKLEYGQIQKLAPAHF